ncbi:MAG: hypothetical protein A2259_05295 [Candidatus Moranbacteria bacterium RIFOXYA2_FULL_43_15]|nr:MAG: hypothetical protein A2259_05295 [Candidatus Moranbacteria bacterium RIFOXYA2_FULL_43_15]
MVTAELLKKFDFKAMGLGYLFFVGTNQAFDYVLYPYVIYQRGPFWGGIVMMLLSAASCLVIVLIYDLVKKDWLGIEAIKEIREEIKNLRDCEKKKFRKMLAWFLKKGHWAEFLFLSLKFDPFVTTVYLRNGVKKFNGFKKEEWRIFIASVFVSNVYWTMLSFSGVEIFLKIFDRI